MEPLVHVWFATVSSIASIPSSEPAEPTFHFWAFPYGSLPKMRDPNIHPRTPRKQGHRTQPHSYAARLRGVRGDEEGFEAAVLQDCSQLYAAERQLFLAVSTTSGVLFVGALKRRALLFGV